MTAAVRDHGMTTATTASDDRVTAAAAAMGDGCMTATAVPAAAVTTAAVTTTAAAVPAAAVPAAATMTATTARIRDTSRRQ
jgi:hypothetical protein